MKKININKVFTQYRDEITPTSPIEGRSYTMTHSDITADLFVTVGLKYAEDQVNNTRDEVRLKWIKRANKLSLYGEVLVNNKDMVDAAFIRNEIFLREMPTALQAIRYGDRFLFMKNTELDNTKVLIKFISTEPAYNKLYNYGTIGMYNQLA